MKSSSNHFWKEEADFTHLEFTNCCSPWNGHSRRKWKTIFLCFYIVLAMWIIGTLLSYVIDGEKNSVGKLSSGAEKESRNVFELFNSHKIIFGGFNVEEEREIATPVVKKSAQELSQRENPKRSTNKSNTHLNQFLFAPNPLLPKADCSKVIKGDLEAIECTKLLNLEMRSKVYAAKKDKLEKFDETLVAMTLNCTDFVMKRNYITRPMTIEEKSYPLAYIITVHKKFAIFERLLRSIYHPQNIYCIHVDKKSSSYFIDGVQSFARCFPNVFVASSLSEVHYTHWSRVQADLNCFKDLVKKKAEVPWKYVINLCGQDFPLKTNLEITRSLKALHGFNNMESVTPPPHKRKRFEYQFVLPSDSKNEYAVVDRTDIKKAPPPIDTPMFVGSAYYVWKRQAVELMLIDPTVKKFLKWSEDTYSPDEHVWATLQRWYPHMPGSHPPHSKYDLNELQSITRLVKWGGLDTSVYPKCAGQYSRGVCVYGVGDLSWLLQQHHLFANKFDSAVDPYAIECLDMWLRNKTITQTLRYITNGYL